MIMLILVLAFFFGSSLLSPSFNMHHMWWPKTWSKFH